MSKSHRDLVFEVVHELQSNNSHYEKQTLAYKITDLLKSPECPLEVVEEVARLNIAMVVNSEIAQAIPVSEESLAILCKNATYRWEWRSLNTAYNRVLAPTQDYSLIFQDKNLEFTNPAEFVKAIADDLASILWQELAQLDLLTFYYSQDISEGDHFGPRDLDFDSSPAEYLLSPGFEVDWVDRKDLVEAEFIVDRIEDEWESFAPEINLIGALSHGAINGHLKPIDDTVFQEIFEELDVMSDMEAQFIYTEVTPNLEKMAKNLAKAGYSNLADDTKHKIASAVVETLDHPFLGGFKISHHLMRLLHMHPATPKETKSLIALHQ